MILKILKYLFKDFYIFTAAYSNDVFPEPLSKEDEEENVKKMLLGDKNARNKLIEHNLRLVAHIVKKYDNKNETDDLISIGTIGLIKGIDTFSYKHGTRITTYCARCIENEILMFLRKNKKRMGEVSFEDSINLDSEGNELHIEDVFGTEEDIVHKSIEDYDNKILLENEIKKLNGRDKEIIELRYGLFGKKELTQKELADKLDISQSYISRIEKKVIRRLKDLMKV